MSHKETVAGGSHEDEAGAGDDKNKSGIDDEEENVEIITIDGEHQQENFILKVRYIFKKKKS